MKVQRDPTEVTQPRQCKSQLRHSKGSPSTARLQERRMSKSPNSDLGHRAKGDLIPFICYKPHRFLPSVLAMRIISSPFWEHSVHSSNNSSSSAMAMPCFSHHRHVWTLQCIFPPIMLFELTWDSGHIFLQITQQALGSCIPVSKMKTGLQSASSRNLSSCIISQLKAPPKNGMNGEKI